MELPIPAELGPRFTVGSALDAGVRASRLRRSDIAHPFFGVCALAAPEPSVDRLGQPLGVLEAAHLRRCLEYAAVMSASAFFSHESAAALWGIPLPAWAVTNTAVHVGVFTGTRLPRGTGVRGHELAPHLAAVVIEPRTGLRVTTPATTWAALGRVLRDPRDLIAAGDGVVRKWRVTRPLAQIDELEAVVRAGRRVGINALRAALPHIRDRSGSRPETHLRLLLVDARLPEPRLNFDIHHRGESIACVDQAYPEAKIAIEYEGEHHLTDPQQWARDIARYERLTALGWIVVRVTKTDLFDNPWNVVERVRAALARRAAGHL